MMQTINRPKEHTTDQYVPILGVEITINKNFATEVENQVTICKIIARALKDELRNNKRMEMEVLVRIYKTYVKLLIPY